MTNARGGTTEHCSSRSRENPLRILSARHAPLWPVEVGQTGWTLNTRDAMPEGGKLTVESADAYLDEG